MSPTIPTTTTLPPPPVFDDPGAALDVRDELMEMGIAEARDLTDLGPAMLPRASKRALLTRRLRLDPENRLLAAAMLFFDQVPIPPAALGDLAERLLRLGLVVRTTDDLVVCPYAVSPLDRVLVIGDVLSDAPEMVMPVGPGTIQLADLLPVGVERMRVLDLCAGPGSVGLVAASRGADVVLTDLSDRCIQFMRANAALNGLTVDIRQGDLFEPVKGETFDVISCHPPYFELPDDVGQVMFLHGGSRGDELPLAVLSGIDEHLGPGGEAVVLYRAPGDLDDTRDRAREAISSGLDSVLFCTPIPGPDMRAAASARLHDPDLGPTFEALLLSYREHIARLGEASTSTMAYLRRKRDKDTAAPYTVFLAGERHPGTRAALDRYLASVMLAAASDESLLLKRFTLPPGSAFVQFSPVGEGEPRYELRLPPDALAGDRVLTPATATLLDAITRTTTLASAIDLCAGATGADPMTLAKDVLEFIREHVVRGILVAADDSLIPAPERTVVIEGGDDVAPSVPDP